MDIFYSGFARFALLLHASCSILFYITFETRSFISSLNGCVCACPSLSPSDLCTLVTQERQDIFKFGRQQGYLTCNNHCTFTFTFIGLKSFDLIFTFTF